MKKFIDFVEKLYSNQYQPFFHKLIAEKTPVGVFAPLSGLNFQLDIINQFKHFGMNMNTLFTMNETYPELPADINRIDLTPPPPVNKDVKYIFVPLSFLALTIMPKLIEWGYDPIILEASGTTKSTVDFYMNHLNQVYEVYQQLTDEESKDALLGYILGKISNRLSFCKYSNNIQYILDGYLPKQNDIVIDCGVCDGATSAMFTDLGCNVIGFEMDRQNFELAKKLADEKKFTVENLGLGDEPKEVTYSHVDVNIGATTINVNGKQNFQGMNPTVATAKIITLDSYVAEKKLPRVDFIKMDTEGAELSILKGATSTITRFKPTLALSAYHKLEDVFELINFIKSLRPDYKFAFRHYGTTPEVAPFIFPEMVKKFCREVDVKLNMISTSELVLFAH